MVLPAPITYSKGSFMTQTFSWLASFFEILLTFREGCPLVLLSVSLSDFEMPNFRYIINAGDI